MCNIWYYVQACLPNLRLYRHPSAFQYESNEQTTVGRPCRGVGQDADTRTPEQKKAMLELLTELKKIICKNRPTAPSHDMVFKVNVCFISRAKVGLLVMRSLETGGTSGRNRDGGRGDWVDKLILVRGRTKTGITKLLFQLLRSKTGIIKMTFIFYAQKNRNCKIVIHSQSPILNKYYLL